MSPYLQLAKMLAVAAFVAACLATYLHWLFAYLFG